MKIPLSNPFLTSREKQSVLKVLNTSNLSLGPSLTEFENLFSDYLQRKYAIAVNSGTSGLHLCIKALNVRKGDEIITTPFSFIASANCILYERATPIFVDIDSESLNINVAKIEEKITQKTKALLPVHIFGQPCQMDEILAIAQKHNLKIIEDACEAIGAEYCTEELEIENHKFENRVRVKCGEWETRRVGDMEGDDEKLRMWRKVGTFGDVGVFAFYPNKQITTGEGGMIVTDNEELAKLCRSLRNQGRGGDGHWLIHERLGYNYRISDINCALGIVQLQRIVEILKKRDQVARWYNERLREIPEIKIPCAQPNCRISWFVYVIRLSDEFTEVDRDTILEKLLSEGIGSSKYFQPIHLQPFYVKMFGYQRGDFPVTEQVAERTLALPFYTQLREEQVDYVCEVFKRILRSNRNLFTFWPQSLKGHSDGIRKEILAE